MKQIPLTQGLSAMVDDADYEILSQHRWYVTRNRHINYACRWVGGTNGKHLRMHRLIMQAPSGMEIDHIDFDGLNNCRANLRVCSRAQNLRHSRKLAQTKTTSKYKGVCWDRRDRKWRARIRISDRRVSLGNFGNEQEAALAYNAAAIQYHGEYAILNDIQRRSDVG